MMSLLWTLAAFCCGLLAMTFLRRIHRRKADGQPTASEEFRTMSRRLAHEIRNPLNTMNLHVQLLQEELLTLQPPPQNAQRRLSRLEQEIQRLDSILTAYQGYARLPEPQLAECNLTALLADLIAFIEPEAQHRNITLENHIAPLPLMQLDEEQIRQMLLNLILNASQAMPDGGILQVRVGLSGDNVRIDVEDTGQGIPEQVQPHIFEPFYSTKEEGSGIGLSMAKYIAEGHGGQIRFQTIPGQGTTFTVLLPWKR